MTGALARGMMTLLVTVAAGFAMASDVVDEDGTVRVPAFEVPLSSYMSEEAKAKFIEKARQPASGGTGADGPRDIHAIRRQFEQQDQPLLEQSRAVFAVDIHEQKLGGVRTRVITPKEGVVRRNRERVLINLHGGAFALGAESRGLIESIPLASVGRIKVVTVDYRQGPENSFPAASEDVALVYRELLKTYEARNVGIFGCSAGGVLAAMAVAWIDRHRLPAPGAVGIFGAGAFGGFYDPPAAPGSWGGDSRFTAPALIGQRPIQAVSAQTSPLSGYLRNADLSDPLVSPALSPAVMVKFPPTLLITGTRAYDMSAAVQTQRVLTKAGVHADLHLWDGMGHCFFVDTQLPESREAFAVMTKFFDTHLGR